MVSIYRFESTPELHDLEVRVGLESNEIKFDVLGPQADFFSPLIKLYFDWFNRIGPITTHEGSNIYSLYLPPIPSAADARLLEGVFRDKLFRIPTPRAVTIAVTQDCQCKCRHCSAEEYSRSTRPLTAEEILNIIDESIALGLCNVTFTGGETLLRKDLERFISYVPEDKALTKIFTNGALLDEKRAGSLKAAGLHAVKVSLDSPDPAEHDEFRGRAGSFNEVERAVKCALDAGLLVGISTYATNESVGENKLERIAALGSRWGVHEISVFDVIPTGRLLHQDEMIMTEDTHEKVVEQSRILNRANGGRPRIITQSWTNTPEGFAAYFGCLAGTYQFHITPSGEFTPCDFTPLSFGNIRTESITKLWKKLNKNPAYCKHQRKCRMQSRKFREQFIDPIPGDAKLPYAIEKLERVAAEKP
jgi:MoaA/NifB/PqqE/SkfB family radical SAM enzyme